MEAQVWTLIGLLAGTVVGAFVYLGQRIDGLGSSLGSRIEGLDTRIDGFSTRMDHLSARVEDQGRELSGQIYQLAQKLDEHLRWHAS